MLSWVEHEKCVITKGPAEIVTNFVADRTDIADTTDSYTYSHGISQYNLSEKIDRQRHQVFMGDQWKQGCTNGCTEHIGRCLVPGSVKISTTARTAEISIILTLSTLGKIFCRRHTCIEIFFLIFPRKQVLTFLANFLHWRQFAWNVKSCVLGKLRKNITSLSPAELAHYNEYTRYTIA